MDEKKPSEVFLALWYSRISGQVISRDEFFALAETWAEIRRMESSVETYMERSHEAYIVPVLDPKDPEAPPESTPEGVQKVHSDRVEKVHEDTEEIPPSDASGASSPEGGAKAGVVQNGPDPAKSAAAAAGMANRKRNDMARLEALRARGVSMQTVAESAAGLTLNDVLDFLDRKPIQLRKLVALEKAMKKLEVGA